jgi:hypothetical protein
LSFRLLAELICESQASQGSLMEQLDEVSELSLSIYRTPSLDLSSKTK